MVLESGAIDAARTLCDGSITDESDKRLAIENNPREFNVEQFKDLLRTADRSPQIFKYFNFSVRFNGDRASIPLVNLRGSGLSVVQDEIQDVDPEVNNAIRKISYFVNEEEYSDLADVLHQGLGGNVGVGFSASIDKMEIGEIVANQLADSSLNMSKIRILFWSTEANFREWISKTDIGSLVNSMFSTDRLPVIIYNEGSTHLGGIVPVVSITDIDGTIGEQLPEKCEEYKLLQQEAEELEIRHPISAAIFSSDYLRDSFSKLFVYSIFSAISDTSQPKDKEMQFVITADKGVIDEVIIFEDWKGRGSAKQELHSLFLEFKQRGSRDVYRMLWKQAIIEHANSAVEIADNAPAILHYYYSLEEKAIEGNFSELSGAVQDAQVFISDVTNTLSSSTVRLTSEVQRIVIALFGIVATNIFLVLRTSNLDTVLPFTVAASASLLLLYFPTSQERVDELSEVIGEGEADAELYSDLIERAGAEEFVGVSRFKDRHEAYIGLAEDRVSWANRQLAIAFALISVAWILLGVYTIFRYKFSSPQYLIVSATLPIAIWIWYHHRDADYYSLSNTGFVERDLSAITFVAIMLLVSILSSLVL